jgi:hypothetical protein
MNPTDIPAWLQAGGLLAFAAAVWMEQRAMRLVMAKQTEHLTAILEHVRGGKALRAPSSPVIGE